MPAQVHANQCTCCDVISCAHRHAHTYPVATQKSVTDYVCLYQLQCNVQMHLTACAYWY